MATHIGLDIGSSAVRAAQLHTGKGVPRLRRIGQVLLPPGAVRDGEIVDSDTVVAAIRELWSTYGFKGRKVALGLANQQVIVRQVDLPHLPLDELRASLGMLAQDHLPISVDDAILDFHPLGTFEGPDGAPLTRLLLVAAQQDMVDAQIDVVQRAKLEPVGVDLAAFASLRSVSTQGEFTVEDGGELIVDMGSSVTTILVHREGLPHFVRILVRGGSAVTEALVQTTGMDWEAAEAAKARIGLNDTVEDADAEAAAVIADRVGVFIEEIRSSVDYFLAGGDAIELSRMIVTGGAGRLPHLVDRLADTLGLPAVPAHPMRELHVASTGLDTDQLVDAEPHMATAVGLAMGAAE